MMDNYWTTEPTYCTAPDCPFRDCETHISRATPPGAAIFSPMYRTCRDYIAYVIENIEKGNIV